MHGTEPLMIRSSYEPYIIVITVNTDMIKIDISERRLLKSIAKTDITLFQAISRNIIDFEDVTSITDIGLQRLIREVDYHDLLLALSSSDSEVQSILLKNMSSSKRAVVLEDLRDLPQNISPEEFDEAKCRITITMDNLRSAGAISTRLESGDEYI